MGVFESRGSKGPSWLGRLVSLKEEVAIKVLSARKITWTWLLHRNQLI
jgi:hypothetical protein